MLASRTVVTRQSTALSAAPVRTQLTASRRGSQLVAMGLRHVVILKLIPDVTQEQIETMKSELGKLPGIIPQIKKYTFNTDMKISEGNADFAVVADFENEVGLIPVISS